MVFARAFAVWLILMVVESVHGIVRRLVLEPWLGDLPARQVSVITGSALILVVTYLFIAWIDAVTPRQLTLIGAMWVSLTIAFEIGLGRLAFSYSWDRIVSDFNVAEGGLLGLGLLIMAIAPRIAATIRRVNSPPAERQRSLPGDAFIANPIGSLTYAITVNCRPESLWPWLVQMGAGRGGWYSYDLIDNAGNRSANQIISEFQTLSMGAVFPALPGATDDFRVLAFKPEQFLVLGAVPEGSTCAVTWAFVLERSGSNATRLITRARANTGYRLHGIPMFLVKGIHFVMQRKQLIGIKRRAERCINVAKLPVARLKLQSFDGGL